MRVPMVLCHYRFHSHSEWSFMRSGAKGFDVFYEGRSAVTAVVKNYIPIHFHSWIDLRFLVNQCSIKSLGYLDCLM